MCHAYLKSVDWAGTLQRCNGLCKIYNIWGTKFTPVLPITVIVQFDKDSSCLSDIPRRVPISPLINSSDTLGSFFERQQLPLKLSWKITIHKSQGLTLDQAWEYFGETEKVVGLA